MNISNAAMTLSLLEDDVQSFKCFAI